MKRAGDQGDPTVSQVEQVLHSGLHADGVVGSHHRGSPLELVDLAVQQDDGDIEALELGDGPGPVLVCQRSDQTIDPPPAEQPHHVLVPLWAPFRVGEDHRVPGRLQLGARPHHKVGEEGVGDVGDDETNRRSQAAAETRGHEVGLVAEDVDCIEDTPTHRLTDIGVVVEDTGHRGEGDTGMGRHLFHRGRDGMAVDRVSAH